MSPVSALVAPLFAPPRARDRRRAEQIGWSQPVVDIEFDQPQSTLWAFLAASAPMHVSLRLLSELGILSDNVRNGRYGQLRYRVISSRHPRTFSLGGDLRLFLDLIRAADRTKLIAYGKAAIDEVWANVTGCGRTDLTTVALVNGEAQGGGFEAALSCHLVVAERGTRCGFPESLFGLFPGMGGEHLLAARAGPEVARRLLAKANRYPVEMLHDIGVVDYLVKRGEGAQFVRALIRDEAAKDQIAMRKQQFTHITYDVLLHTVEAWVEQALALTDKSQRSMTYLLNAQESCAAKTYS